MTDLKTAWGGGHDIDEFIEVSKIGRANGDMIMHRGTKQWPNSIPRLDVLSE
jgi:hypothetical protein